LLLVTVHLIFLFYKLINGYISALDVEILNEFPCSKLKLFQKYSDSDICYYFYQWKSMNICLFTVTQILVKLLWSLPAS